MALRIILGCVPECGVNSFKDAPGWSEDGQGWPQGSGRGAKFLDLTIARSPAKPAPPNPRSPTCTGQGLVKGREEPGAAHEGHLTQQLSGRVCGFQGLRD